MVRLIRASELDRGGKTQNDSSGNRCPWKAIPETLDFSDVETRGDVAKVGVGLE